MSVLTDPPVSQQLAKAEEIFLNTKSDNDYELKLRDHRSAFTQDVPALSHLLNLGEMKSAAEQYHTADADADSNQRWHKFSAHTVNGLVLLAATLGALITWSVATKADFPDNKLDLVTIFAVAAAIVAGASTILMFGMKALDFLGKWMNRRAVAETQRLRYFKIITDPKALLELERDPATTEVTNEHYGIAFCYLVRYHLRLQLTFFASRHKDQKLGLYAGVFLGALAAGIGTIASILVTVLTDYAAYLGVVTVVMTALSAFVVAYQGIGQFGKHANRYRDMHAALIQFDAKVNRVLNAIKAGDLEPLSDFVDLLNQELAQEHQQWLETTSKSSEVADKLQKMLAKSVDELPGQDGGGT